MEDLVSPLITVRMIIAASSMSISSVGYGLFCPLRVNVGELGRSLEC